MCEISPEKVQWDNEVKTLFDELLKQKFDGNERLNPEQEKWFYDEITKIVAKFTPDEDIANKLVGDLKQEFQPETDNDCYHDDQAQSKEVTIEGRIRIAFKLAERFYLEIEGSGRKTYCENYSTEATIQQKKSSSQVTASVSNAQQLIRNIHDKCSATSKHRRN